MDDRFSDVLDKIIKEVDTLIRFLKRGTPRQVRSTDEKMAIQASSYAWFKSHRAHFDFTHPILNDINSEYSKLLEYCEKETSRSTYLDTLKSLKEHVIKFRSALLASADPIERSTATAINFGNLIADEKIQTILTSRWIEIQRCLAAEAPLAASIMMGSMLEAMFLARVNKENNLGAVFRSQSAPKNRKTGKSLSLSEWTLNDFIQVAAEIGWIGKPARDVGLIIRDYRNLIHPEKQLRSGITVEIGDAKMFWSIFTTLIDQIIQSAK